MRPVFDAQSLNLSHLNPVHVSYDPKDIHTEAIQVDERNIGKLSLEFEEELFYDSEGRPYFVFSAKRFDDDELDGQKAPHELFVRLTDWLVPLRDELHVFRHGTFVTTFTFDDGEPAARPFIVPRDMVGDGPAMMQYFEEQGKLNWDTPHNPNETVGTFRRPHRNEPGSLAAAKQEEDDIGIRQPSPYPVPKYVQEVPFEGTVSGPSGTHVMPRVEE
jgi:hypothetical protein